MLGFGHGGGRRRLCRFPRPSLLEVCGYTVTLGANLGRLASALLQIGFEKLDPVVELRHLFRCGPLDGGRLRPGFGKDPGGLGLRGDDASGCHPVLVPFGDGVAQAGRFLLRRVQHPLGLGLHRSGSEFGLFGDARCFGGGAFDDSVLRVEHGDHRRIDGPCLDRL